MQSNRAHDWQNEDKSQYKHPKPLRIRRKNKTTRCEQRANRKKTKKINKWAVENSKPSASASHQFKLENLGCARIEEKNKKKFKIQTKKISYRTTSSGSCANCPGYAD